MDIVSNCCNAWIDTDILICSDCKEHADAIDLDLLCEMCGEVEMTEEERDFSDICSKCLEI